MKTTLVVLAAGLIASAKAFAQFDSTFLQNEKYWNDGKAEFAVYDAKIVRYGQPRPCEVIHILVREPFDPEQLVKPDDWQKPGVISALKMNQILHVPTGIYVYQQMHSSFWNTADAALVKWSLTSNDSCGNTFKNAQRKPGANEGAWRYHYHTYWDGMAEGEQLITPPEHAYFYDELPLRVRTIDFAKATGEFDIQLAASAINSKKDALAFMPAKVSYQKNENEIVVTVTHAGGVDRFTIDPVFPHLLLAWKMADGGELKLNHALKIDYWKYNKLGDQERALADQSLQLFPKQKK